MALNNFLHLGTFPMKTLYVEIGTLSNFPANPAQKTVFNLAHDNNNKKNHGFLHNTNFTLLPWVETMWLGGTNFFPISRDEFSLVFSAYVIGSGTGSFPRSEITVVYNFPGHGNFFQKSENPGSVKHMNLILWWKRKETPLTPQCK